MKDSEAKSYEEWLKELCVVSLKKRKLRGLDLPTDLQCLKSCHREEGVDLFSVRLVD